MLQYAVDLATAEGLEALTIGRVASAAGLTKAGILGHFGTKEALQIETLDAGRRAFAAAVLVPGAHDPPGLVALVALVERWIDRSSRARGGCFFASVGAEFDAKPGPVRDRVAEILGEWTDVLVARTGEAVRLGHLRRSVASSSIVFRLYGYVLALNTRFQLFRDERAVSEARDAVLDLLLESSTPAGKRQLHRFRRAKR